MNFYSCTEGNPIRFRDPSSLTVFQCFRPLKRYPKIVLAGTMTMPPVPGQSYCRMHGYVYNDAAAMPSKGIGPE